MNDSHHPPKTYLAAFDFDGTITEGDTMIEFIRYVKGSGALYRSYFALGFTLLMYKLKVISNEEAKKSLLAYHFRGWSKELLEEKGKTFCEKKLPAMIRPAAKTRIEWHKQNGHELAVVTSSLSWWVKPWCETNGFHFIGTIPDYENGKFTGEFRTANCYGPEKVKRLDEQLNLKHYGYLYAYGDTRGDREMLARANQSWFKPFR